MARVSIVTLSHGPLIHSPPNKIAMLASLTSLTPACMLWHDAYHLLQVITYKAAFMARIFYTVLMKHHAAA